MATLRDVSLNGTKEDGPRVGAAKALLDATEPNPREVLLKLLKGDKVQLRAWLVEQLAALDKGGGA